MQLARDKHRRVTRSIAGADQRTHDGAALHLVIEASHDRFAAHAVGIVQAIREALREVFDTWLGTRGRGLPDRL